MIPSDAVLTIVLYCFNQEHVLPNAIQKILQYPETPWQCIIIDDGSSDGSAVMIKKIVDSDERFRYVFQQHQGKDVAYQTAKEICGSEKIIMIEATD